MYIHVLYVTLLVRVPGNIIHIHIPMHVVVDSRFIYSSSDLFQHGLLWMYIYIHVCTALSWSLPLCVMYMTDLVCVRVSTCI